VRPPGRSLPGARRRANGTRIKKRFPACQQRFVIQAARSAGER
jgi:hypothetical protein